MISLFDSTELLNYPGVEREVSYNYDNRKVTVSFVLYNEHEEGLEFAKQFPDEETALKSIDDFYQVSKQKKDRREINDRVNTDKFLRELMANRYRFFSDLINDKIDLPDDGKGFVFLGNKTYLAQLVAKFVDIV